jgi:hypothetical protein
VCSFHRRWAATYLFCFAILLPKYLLMSHLHHAWVVWLCLISLELHACSCNSGYICYLTFHLIKSISYSILLWLQ